jgi:hypothetical protein
MLAFAAIGSSGTVLLLVIGSYLTAIHHSGGVPVLVIGAVSLLFWLVLGPVALRRANV